MNTLWILPAILHMAALIPAGESCVESVTPSLVFATMGEIITFNCTSSCNSLAWETRFRKVNSPPLRGSFSSQQVSVDSWEESSVDCMDNDAIGDEVSSATAIVIPYALPSSVELEMKKDMEEGQIYVGVCRVYNVAPVRLVTISYIIDGTEYPISMNEDDDRMGEQNLTQTFQITAKRYQTKFGCRATMNLTNINNTMVSSSFVNVSVLYPPKFTSCLESPIWIEGRDTTFYCLAEGNPTPTVQCHIQNRKFHPPSNFTLGRDASGVYECEASNRLKNVTQSVKLTVQYPPEFTLCPESLVWVEGRDTTFYCSAEGNPAPTVKCHFQNREFHPPSTFTLGRNMSGVYECLASNHLNITLQSVNLTVQYPPGSPEVISSANSLISVGETFKLSCNADARPPPLYHWIVPLGATVTYSPDNRTITIGSASSAHSGNYTCVVSNAHGQSKGWRLVGVEKGKKVGIIIIGVIVAVLLIVPVIIALYRKKTRPLTTKCQIKTVKPDEVVYICPLADV